MGLLAEDADLAIVVGGYNSSNTMHIVELLEGKFPTYHIAMPLKWTRRSKSGISISGKQVVKNTSDWLPAHPRPLTVAITSGASVRTHW